MYSWAYKEWHGFSWMELGDIRCGKEAVVAMGGPRGKKRSSKKKFGSHGKRGKPSTSSDPVTAVAGENPEELTFNDQFEDEFASEEEVHSGDEAMKDSGDNEPEIKVWRPGIDKMEDDEEQEMDYESGAYDMFHRLTAEWPCLSLSVIPDHYGKGRRRYPLSMYVAAGSQADVPDKNRLYVMKFSDLHRTKFDDDPDAADDDDDDALDDDPIIEHRAIPHEGGVNRIRAIQQAGYGHVMATWADTGKVHIWDVSRALTSLDNGWVAEGNAASSNGLGNLGECVQTFTGHAGEGFAMDWSRTTTGRFLTGDCSKFIYLWEPRDEGCSSWEVSAVPFSGHTASVEDIQWSPVQKDVFCSAGVDQSILVWDARQRQKPALKMANCHDCDINVISWNSLETNLLASGADDGVFRIWDFRQPTVPAAEFSYHRDAITSIEWSPDEGSVLIVSSADNSTTLWDLAVEADEEDMAVAREHKLEEFPPQLLFVHQGQSDVKEVHWHPQCPGTLVSTSADGFHVFKPSNTDSETVPTS